MRRYRRDVTVRAIVQIGHPVLRARAREVAADELGTPELMRICDDLVETMRAANGAGLAAPQVDIPLRIFAVEVGDNPRYPYKPRLGLRVLVNPVVRSVSDETYQSYEGCLSIPDLRGLLPRAVKVAVTYLDAAGETQYARSSAGSAPARCNTSSTTSTGCSSRTGWRTPRRSARGRCSERTTRMRGWTAFEPLLHRFPGETETR